MMPFYPVIKGKKELKRVFDKARQMGEKIHSMTGNSLDVWGCGDLIYERGTVGFSSSTNEAPHPMAHIGSFFTIWQKQDDGSYKVKYFIWNLDYNPWKR